MMLINFFNAFINMSISAALVTLAILLIRRVFSRRLPTLFAYVLWGVVLFRFAVPISIPALFSGLGLAGRRSYPAGPGGLAATVRYLEPGELPLVDPGSAEAVLWRLSARIWVAGAVALLLFGLVGYWRIHRRSDMAFVVRDNAVLTQCSRRAGLHRVPALYRSGDFSSPVIVGIAHPRIILPTGLDLEDTARLRHILIHECVHLRRRDHIIKALFSLVLCLHWFNPLAWLACMLFDRDVEASCDERSLALLGEENKAGYARSLIDLSQTQQSFLRRRIAFSESSLRLRVMNIVRYRPLTGLKRAAVVVLLLLIGVVTVTNPLHAPDIFVPRRHAVSQQAAAQMEAATSGIMRALDDGSPQELLALSQRGDDHYLPLYGWLEDTPLAIAGYRLYPQTESLAYSYLTAADGRQYVAVLEDGALVTLQNKAEFEAGQMVDGEDEAVRLVENLHSFGILQQIATPAEIPRPAVAMLCIDEVYRDKLAAGEITPAQIYLDPADIAQAARDYFGIRDFSYTFDPDLYDAARGAYIYAPDRGGRYDAQVISLEHGDAHTTVTAVVYSDPLHLIPDSQITYTLQRRDSVAE